MTDHEDPSTSPSSDSGTAETSAAEDSIAADGPTGADTGDTVAPSSSDDDAIAISREKAIRIAQVGLVVLALLVVGVVLLTKGDDKDTASKDKTSTSKDADTKKSTAKPVWPKNVGGRPPALGKRGQAAADVTLGKDAKPGIYLWNDFDGWHLWVVNGEGVPAVKGTMTSNDTVAKAESAVPDAGTVVLVDKVATFELPTDQPIVGINFNPGFFANNLVFTLEGPDGAIDETLVHVGAKAEQAPFPLVIAKAPPAS